MTDHRDLSQYRWKGTTMADGSEGMDHLIGGPTPLNYDGPQGRFTWCGSVIPFSRIVREVDRKPRCGICDRAKP